MINELAERNWLVYKIAEDALAEVVRKYARGRLADIGCWEKPYT